MALRARGDGVITLVYKYALRAPVGDSAELAERRLWAANCYRNLLVEVERGRRAALRALEMDPQLDGYRAALAYLEVEVEEAAQVVAAWRARTRKRRAPKSLMAPLRELRARVKRARQGIRMYRTAWVLPGLTAGRDQINERAKALRRSVRRHREQLTGEQLYHGTYCAVEDAVDRSARVPLWDGLRPNDPRYLRYNGRGTLGCQIQGGITVSEVEGDRRLQIVRTAAEARTCRPGRPGVHRRCTADRCTLHERDPSRARQRQRNHHVLRMRLGTTAERQPLWIEAPILLHRPLPEDGRIMHAEIIRSVHPCDMGTRDEWHLLLRVRLPQHTRPARRAVAVDLGWRMLPDGSMRVAYWRGEDGRHGQLVLTERQLSGLIHHRGIRSVRDTRQDVLRAAVTQWIDRLEDVPQWLADQRRYMVHWRAPHRWHRLAQHWDASIPTPPDSPTAAQVGDWLHAWSRRDHHLHAYEDGQRGGSRRQRRDHYRQFARWLGRRYDVVVLEKFDLRGTGKKAPEAAGTEGVSLRDAQRLASPHSLVEALRSRYGQDGHVVEIDAINTTRRCSDCGADLVGDPADDIVQHCTRGHVWDQDDNACRNMLARFREQWDPEQKAGTSRGNKAPKSETRWERARRRGAERTDRIGTARNPPATPAE